MKTVSVIVTSHNGRRFMKACLSALLATRMPAGWQLQPIVVDNGSTDGTDVFLSTEFPNVRALIFKNALGFAGANNAARSEATGDVVVFLNSDTEVTPDWLMRPLEILESDSRVSAVGSLLVFQHRFRECRVIAKPGAKLAIGTKFFGTDLDSKVRWGNGFSQSFHSHIGEVKWATHGAKVYVPDPIPGLDPVSPHAPVIKVVGIEGNPKDAEIVCADHPVFLSKKFPQARYVPNVSERVDLIQAAGGQVTRDGAGGDYATGIPVSDVTLSETIVPSICGASFIARRSVLDAVGWFPKDYLVYYEDTHLCMQLRMAGGMLVFCPSSVVRHYHTGTNKEWSPFFIENVARSQLIFTANFGSPSLIRRRLREQVGHGAREVIAASQGPLGKLWSNIHGTRGVVKSLPSIVRVGARRMMSRSFDEQHSALAALTVDRIPYQASKPMERVS
jgi:GT2 family glycosyltransferase